ncbi:MAG: Holliday junction branch migration protein RuvA [Bacilli bacterium]
MFNYIKGIITECGNNYVVLENNGIGYTIFVGNPYSFTLNNEYTVYVYNHIREDENSLYGFKSKDEKDLFLKLINVKGLGPKMAMPMFATGSVNGIMDAIERENILYLTKFPKIGDKLARQIILDLKGKLAKMDNGNLISSDFEELISVLESLGYKNSDIKRILPNIDPSLSVEEQVKEALKLMLK